MPPRPLGFLRDSSTLPPHPSRYQGGRYAVAALRICATRPSVPSAVASAAAPDARSSSGAGTWDGAEFAVGSPRPPYGMRGTTQHPGSIIGSRLGRTAPPFQSLLHTAHRLSQSAFTRTTLHTGARGEEHSYRSGAQVSEPGAMRSLPSSEREYRPRSEHSISSPVQHSRTGQELRCPSREPRGPDRRVSASTVRGRSTRQLTGSTQ